MAANDIPLQEIEWRSYAVLESATGAILEVKQNSQRTFALFDVWRRLKGAQNAVRALLDLFHETGHISVIESAGTERRQELAARLEKIHGKIDEMISTVTSIRLGSWKRLYDIQVRLLKSYQTEIESLANAVSSVDSQVLLLTREDQEQLFQDLLNPPQPTAELLRAFEQK